MNMKFALAPKLRHLSVLKFTFKDLAARGSTGKDIDKNTFLKAFPLPGLIGERLFTLFDKDESGVINYEEFIFGLAIWCRGTVEERMEFLFNMYDLNGDGYVSKADLRTMLNHLPREVVRTMDRGSLDVSSNSELHTAAVDSMVKRAFEECDLDRDGKLSFQSFAKWLEKTPEILQFLSAVFPYGTEDANDEESKDTEGSTPGKRVNQRRKSLEGTKTSKEGSQVKDKGHLFKANSAMSPGRYSAANAPPPPQTPLSKQSSAPSPRIEGSSAIPSGGASGHSTAHTSQTGSRHSNTCAQPTMLSMANPFALSSSASSSAWTTRSFVRGLHENASSSLSSYMADQKNKCMLLPTVSLRHSEECDLKDRLCLACKHCNNSVSFDQHTGAPLATHVNEPVVEHSPVGWSVRCRYSSKSRWVQQLLGDSTSRPEAQQTPAAVASELDEQNVEAMTGIDSPEKGSNNKEDPRKDSKHAYGRSRGRSFSKEKPPIGPEISLIREQAEEDTDSKGSWAKSPVQQVDTYSSDWTSPEAFATENSYGKDIFSENIDEGAESDTDSTASSGTRDVSVIPDDVEASSVEGDTPPEPIRRSKSKRRSQAKRLQGKRGSMGSKAEDDYSKYADIDALARRREISVADGDEAAVNDSTQDGVHKMNEEFRAASLAAKRSGVSGNDALFATSSVVFQGDGAVLTESLVSLCSNCGASHDALEWVHCNRWIERSATAFTNALLDKLEEMSVDPRSLQQLASSPEGRGRRATSPDSNEWDSRVAHIAATIATEAARFWPLRHGESSHQGMSTADKLGMHQPRDPLQRGERRSSLDGSNATYGSESTAEGYSSHTAALHGPFQVPHMDYPHGGGVWGSDFQGRWVPNAEEGGEQGQQYSGANSQLSPVLAATLVASGHVSAEDAIKRSSQQDETPAPVLETQPSDEDGSMVNFDGGSYQNLLSGEDSPQNRSPKDVAAANTSHMRLGAGAARSLTLHGCDMLEKSGALYKVGARFRKLTKRWYYLEQNFLYWYTRQKDSTPRGVLFLEDSYVKPVDDGYKGYYGISIHTSSAHGERTKVLYAKSPQDRDEWLAALRQACRAVPFDEDYEEQEEIGRGRFSQVISAKRKSDGKMFAVKKINKVDLEEDEKELLRTEIAILKLVNHPHIIRLENVYETSSLLYIVMEFLQGGELFDRIVGRSRFKEDEARELVKPLVDAMAYLHSLGIAHRDLKPENVLTGETLHDLKIADFGLSKIIHPTEKMNKPCGTLSYVAPEVLTGKGYGKQADMWSIGVILYLVVRGKLPFEGRDKEEIAAKTVRENLDFNNPIWKQWSKEGLEFVRRLLERDPEKRLSAREALRHPWLRNSTEAGQCYDLSSDDEKPPPTSEAPSAKATGPTTTTTTTTGPSTPGGAMSTPRNMNSPEIPLSCLPPHGGHPVASSSGGAYHDPARDSVASRMQKVYSTDSGAKK
eukprot:gb/GECG01011014.1/.p1 GENE.gb/GECG01011014.1/~~gb/GECG01011014.1/.p1  ORF type:complete len:1451 (+),score=219.92 gb/GECG01011014.1/:1-4353(+)